MYKNILHNPLKATDEEIDALNQRRKKEKQLVLDKDQDKTAEKCWFMVSSDWLFQWKCFISNKTYPPSESIP